LCGIYGFSTAEALAWNYPLRGMHVGRPAIQGYESIQMVWAKVLMWGDVWPHAEGWRAQYARVEHLVYIAGTGASSLEHLSWVADSYGIDVVTERAERLQEINSYIERRRVESTLSQGADLLKACVVGIGRMARAYFRALIDWR
jgi:hypothetical protein